MLLNFREGTARQGHHKPDTTLTTIFHTHQEILIVNTNLLFPHDSTLCIIRLQQVYKILQYVESYQKENKLNLSPSYSAVTGMATSVGMSTSSIDLKALCHHMQG